MSFKLVQDYLVLAYDAKIVTATFSDLTCLWFDYVQNNSSELRRRTNVRNVSFLTPHGDKKLSQTTHLVDKLSFKIKTTDYIINNYKLIN